MKALKKLLVVGALLGFSGAGLGLVVAGELVGVGTVLADSTSWSNCDTPVGLAGGTVPCKSVEFPDLGGHR